MIPRILFVRAREWRTPLTGVPLHTVGTARLVRRYYNGMYRMEGVRGYEYYETKGRMPVAGLQIRRGRQWQMWMVDDPLHWYGMEEAVNDLPPGRILVGGLGLGLMLHHMARASRFTNITVVERSADVQALIRPTLPDDSRVEHVTSDFYEYLTRQERPQFNGILWDLAVGKPSETIVDFIRAQALCALYEPKAQLRQFGVRSTPRPEDLP